MFISDRAERQNQPVLLPDPSNRLFRFLRRPDQKKFRSACIIRKSKCSTDFKRNDFLKKTKRTHWVRFVHLNSLIESCVFLYLWNSPFDTFL